MGRISKTNRFDEGLYKRAREISQNTRIPFSKLLDEGLKYLISKYSSQSMPEPEPVSPVVEKIDTRQIIINLPKKKETPRIYHGSVQLHKKKKEWTGKIWLGTDENGKRKNKTVYLGTETNMTKEKAQTKLQLILDQMNKGADIPKDS